MRFIKAVIVFAFVLGAAGMLFFSPAIDRVQGRQTTAVAAPTGVSASDGDYAGKVGVNWDAIRGATIYRIFRNTTNNGATAADVGTTAANYFFDSTAVTGQVYFYWVRAENGSENSPLSSPDQGVRAAETVEKTTNFEPLEPPVAPTGNPVTAAKAYLGKALFWDEQMSSTRTVSCGTCHRPAAGGSDPRTGSQFPGSRHPGFDLMFGTPDDVFGSPGVPFNLASGTYVPLADYGFGNQVTGRKSPSYLNAGYSRDGLFWDGRATDVFRDPVTNQVVLSSRAALESQSVGPPVSGVEMAHGGRNWIDVAERIETSRPLALATDIPSALNTWIGGRTYRQLFEEAFGTPDVTPARIAMAIATHERTLFSDRTPFDRQNARIEGMTQAELDGMFIFEQANCNVCHSGPLLSNDQFHNIGVRPPVEDRGRGIVTNNAEDNGRFRTPNLRNVELHAPYMHNGRFATLEEVVEFYNRGGDFRDAPNFESGIIRPLGLTDYEKSALVAFMKRPMTDLRVKHELPPFDRPKLFTESGRVPQITGTGRSGSGGFVPQIVATSPPLAGNPNFVISVLRAVGNSNAVLVIDEADPGVGSAIPAAGSLARITASTQNTGAGNGWSSAQVVIPNSAAILGKTFYARWYIEDPAAQNGFSVSEAARFTVFGEAAAATPVSIGGRVTTPAGLGLRNATVFLTDASGVRRTATTSSFGLYQFSDVPTGSGYTMSIASKRFRFTPRLFDLTANVSDFDFVGLE